MQSNSNQRPGSPRRTAFAIVLASIPALLLLILALLNPAYIATFFDPPVRHIGLPILGLIVFLTAVAYPAAIFGSLAVFNSGRRVLGGVFLVLVFALLCLPALLLLLLSPAAFALMQ